MKRYLLMCVFLLGGCLVLNAQTNPYIPTIIPHSPDAAALFKFADVPVSYYTGTADVSVPIYTIEARGLSVPVSLHYNTGGIRLKEEASSVGLGWALNSGGMISRTVMDKDDFTGGWFNTLVPELEGDLSASQPSQSSETVSLGPYFFDLWCNDLVNFSTGQADYEQALQGGPPAFDMEPDIYCYSFPGHMGKFIITRSGQVVLQKQENIRIQFESNGNSFTITDEKGNAFYFADKSYLSTTALPLGAISAWNLSRIVTEQLDTVAYSYREPASAANTAPEITNTYIINSFGSDGSSTSSGSGTSYGNVLLQSIDFTGGHLQFTYDSLRRDEYGGYKLDNIALYSRNNSALTYQREYDLFYSYFNNSIVTSDTLETLRLRLDSVQERSGNLTVPPYTFSYNLPQVVGTVAKHGFNVDHWGYYNGASNSGFIPNSTLYFNPPGGSDAALQAQQFVNYNEGNIRDPQAPYMTAFSLAQIGYPTGGRTVFTWEPNDYDVAKSQNGPNYFETPSIVLQQIQVQSALRGDTSGTIDLSRIYPSLPSNSDQANLTILVTFRSSGGDSAGYIQDAANQATFTFMGKDANTTVDVQDLTLSGSTFSKTLSIPIHAGSPMTYTWSMYINPDVGDYFQDIRVTFQYDTVQLAGEPVGINGNYAKTGGGIRVKAITNYVNADSIGEMRRYEYNYNAVVNGQTGYYSYGIQMAPPDYARYQLFQVGEEGNNYGLVLTGSSLTPMTSPVTDNNIGYSQVTEYRVNPYTNADIGKTVYSYYNVPDSGLDYQGMQFPGILGLGNTLNGSLLSKMDYANVAGSYAIVDSAIFTYHTTNRSIYYTPKYQVTGRTGDDFAQVCTVGTGVDEYLLCFYPSMKSERILTDSTAEFKFDSKYQGNSVGSGKYYFYDNPLHYLPTRIRDYDSKGYEHVAFNRYPQDYLGGGSTTGIAVLDTMIARNIVETPLESGDSLYYPLAPGGAVDQSVLKTYRILPNQTVGGDKIYKLDITGPITNFQPFAVSENTTSQDSRYTQKISFDRYDGSSNIAQYTASDLTPMTFIWDYSHTYPIAKLLNADSTFVAYTSFEADGSGNWSIGSGTVDSTASITGRKSYNLSGSISKSGLNGAMTYIISYWSQNGAYSIPGTISGYPVRGKTVSFNTPGWTLYVHKVTGQSTIALTGSGHIDELRLYPATAQMTTYTYDPLVGMTSETDAGNRVAYYEYDGLERLIRIRDQDYNILKTIEYAYQAPAGCGGNCSTVAMQTLAGTNTLSYPVGVFDVNGNLVGNASNAAGYVSLWNSDTSDARVGALSQGSDSLHFNLAVNAGQTPPAGVTGCRYYQFDLNWNIIDGIRNFNGAYVDFGDGTGMHLGKNNMDPPKVIAPNTTYAIGGYHDFSNNIFLSQIYFIHTYSDTTLKTLTFYHNDDTTNSDLDNINSPATSLNRLTNLRGNLPQNTLWLGGSSYEQPGAMSVAGITNWNTITNVLRFNLQTGDFGDSYPNHVAYTQDFMKNNKGLQYITIAQCIDTGFKVSRLKSDWNTYFTQLFALSITDAQWSRENLSALTNLWSFGFSSTSTNGAGVIDSIINQIATGAGHYRTNGVITITWPGYDRTAASADGYTYLKSRNWIVYINGVYE
jgi:YD repeat-containing protein